MSAPTRDELLAKMRQASDDEDARFDAGKSTHDPAGAMLDVVLAAGRRYCLDHNRRMRKDYPSYCEGTSPLNKYARCRENEVLVLPASLGKEGQ